MRRREAGMPEEASAPGGHMIKRNPGVALVWITKTADVIVPERGKPPLFRMGEPRDVLCFAEGREATVDEIRASVDSGMPILLGIAESEGLGAVRALEAQAVAARRLLGIA
jgi:hypothetical protein